VIKPGEEVDEKIFDHSHSSTMSSASHRQSIATGLWQAVLYADGYLSQSGVDCDFGPNTTSATRAWQGAHSVGVDGSVGPQTLGRADDKLRISSTQNGVATLIYDGAARDITFIRNSPGDATFPGGYRVPYVEDNWQYVAQYHLYIGDC
jgi:peptidoglycan hydrolase-like protein with peptidoglycan-binding domain